MRVFRICRRSYARNPLDGRGGLFVGGRWHTPRRLVTNTSDSLALASLEVLVHCDLDLVPTDLVSIEIELPDTLKPSELPLAKLPRHWRKYPAPPALQRLGNAWLDVATSAALRVPSAIIPSEHNYLLNPAHPDMRALRVVRKADFQLDPRLGAR
jgi:RES domain-containing protein